MPSFDKVLIFPEKSVGFLEAFWLYIGDGLRDAERGRKDVGEEAGEKAGVERVQRVQNCKEI